MSSEEVPALTVMNSLDLSRFFSVPLDGLDLQHFPASQIVEEIAESPFAVGKYNGLPAFEAAFMPALFVKLEEQHVCAAANFSVDHKEASSSSSQPTVEDFEQPKLGQDVPVSPELRDLEVFPVPTDFAEETGQESLSPPSLHTTETAMAQYSPPQTEANATTQAAAMHTSIDPTPCALSTCASALCCWVICSGPLAVVL